MKVHTPATIQDLYQVDGKAELVDGEIVYMTPTGFWPARAGARILHSLMDYQDQGDQTHLGTALPDNTGYIVSLPRRKTFSPDVSYFIGTIPEGSNMRFVDGAPIFAVEVRSEGDYGPSAEKKIASKRADYFAAGTHVVWDVDLLSDDVVRAYRADNPETPTLYRKGEMAEAEPALPGWKMPVDDLFR